jgi:sigma-B regulation protein RsbU (phosphoserine phosphatase)
VNRVDGHAFTEADQGILQTLADQVSASLHYAGLRGVLAEKKRLDNDLHIARRIQASLLPKNLPDVPGLGIAAFNEPARAIGGDYYDVIRVDADHLGIVIADVAGKGISGALMMTICRSVLRAQAPGQHSPSAVLRAMSRVISRDITSDMFITALYMVLDLRTMRITLARAGHERPLLLARDGTHQRPDSAGVAIGMGDPELFDAVVRDTTIDLHPGDTIVIFTDGITDALDSAEKQWGLDRFVAACTASASAGAQELLHRVRDDLTRHVGGHEQYDDMTLLALRRTS